MTKPSWKDPNKDVWVTDPPSIMPEDIDAHIENFLCYNGYGQRWNAGWKTYSTLWACLRYGMHLGKNKNFHTCIKNLKTNEIVWRSWEDANPYRYRI